jgi:hypothetical protein
MIENLLPNIIIGMKCSALLLNAYLRVTVGIVPARLIFKDLRCWAKVRRRKVPPLPQWAADRLDS